MDIDLSPIFESTAYREACAAASERMLALLPKLPKLPRQGPSLWAHPTWVEWRRPEVVTNIGSVVVDESKPHGEWWTIQYGTTCEAITPADRMGPPTLIASTSTLAELGAVHLAEAYRPEGVP